MRRRPPEWNGRPVAVLCFNRAEFRAWVEAEGIPVTARPLYRAITVAECRMVLDKAVTEAVHLAWRKLLPFGGYERFVVLIGAQMCLDAQDRRRLNTMAVHNPGSAVPFPGAGWRVTPALRQGSSPVRILPQDDSGNDAGKNN